MKIAMIVNNLEVSGGYQKLVIRLAQALKRIGHDVTTYSPSVNTKACYPNDIKDLRIITDKNLQTLDSVDERMSKLARIVDTDYDLFIIHDPDSLTTINNLKFGKSKPNIIWMLNNQLPDVFTTYSKAVRKSFKSTAGLNPYARIKIAFEEYLKLNKLRSTTDRIDVFATYDTFNQVLVEKNLRRKATIVFAGADLIEFENIKRSAPTEPLKHIKLLSVGVLFPHRRYEDLINAVAILKKRGLSVELSIVGRHDLHNEYANSLKRLVSKKRLQKAITFIEYAPQKQLMNLYKNCDIFMFVNDGFTWGISVFEAVAARIPVVITDNIGASDLITTNKTGWVVQPRSPEEITNAILSIAKNPLKVTEITSSAYDAIYGLLQWDEYAKRLLNTVK